MIFRDSLSPDLSNKRNSISIAFSVIEDGGQDVFEMMNMIKIKCNIYFKKKVRINGQGLFQIPENHFKNI